MIKNAFVYLLAISVVGVSPVTAADRAATVTEVANDVTHGSLQSAESSKAEVGTHLQDGEYLKTGVKSRAELELANESITRLGANTIFNYSVADNQIDLQAGTVLFSKPKDGKQMNIKTASVTAAIVGTTGFVQQSKHGFLFGLVEGHAHLTVSSKDYDVTAGQILRFVPGTPPQIFSYNVSQFLKTSPLIHRFHSRLPNQADIDKELAEYDDLVERGFIEPPTEPFFLTDFDGSVPTVPIPGHDSAGNALNNYNNPPPPPPPNNPYGYPG